MVRILLFALGTDEQIAVRLFTMFFFKPFSCGLSVLETANQVNGRPIVSLPTDVTRKRCVNCHVSRDLFDDAT